MQLNHPDLQSILATNAGDPADGGDNDLNGFVDDSLGWDFAGVPGGATESSNAGPQSAQDNHGTQVAGAAAAIVNNGVGVAGIGRGQLVLPIKIAYSEPNSWNQQVDFVPLDRLATAVRYAGGSGRNGGLPWAGSDVVNLSYRLAQIPVLDTAFDWTRRFGRQGWGCAITAASGNAANAALQFGEISIQFSFTTGGAGNFRWEYQKDAFGSSYEDAMWIDAVLVEQSLDGGVNWISLVTVNFTGTLFPPTGWTSGSDTGGANWSRSTQAGRVFGGTGGSARSGTVADNGRTWLQTPVFTVSNNSVLRLRYQLLANCDPGEALQHFLAGTPIFDPLHAAGHNVGGIEYPARYAGVIGVGASDAHDERTAYSQFGTGLALVAPGVSPNPDPLLVTTDRTGASGTDPSDYAAAAGTSLASPLIAGTGALMLSEAADRGFDLTSAEVGILLRASTDKVGGVIYTGGEGTGGGYNAEFGYGRLNAAMATQFVHFSRAELAGWTGSDLSASTPLLAGSSRRFEEIGMRSLRTSAEKLGLTNPAHDECRFVYQDMSGNSQIVALVNSIGGTAAGALTGLMIRDGATAYDAKHATVGLTGDGKATFIRRASSGGTTTTTNVNSINPPYWVRLVRSSNTITAARSANGTTWTTIGTVSLALGATYQIGLVATSGTTDAALATGTLTNVEVLGPGIINTIAGIGSQSSTGDGGPASSGSMARPGGLVFAASGDLYVAETMGNRIRMINTAGIISTPIGTGIAGFADGPAASAQFSSSGDVAFDRNNRLYIADTNNHRIRRWDPNTGQVSTIVGTGTAGYSGDGGPPLSAQLNYPHGVCVDAAGRVYIAERSPSGAGRIRRVDINSSGTLTTITTFAGGATPGVRGDGLLATQAWLIDPHDVVVDEADNVYIADTYDYRVRRVDGSTGIITTVAGNGNLTFSGDAGAATAAGIGYVPGVAVAENGDVYLTSETVSPVANRVRKIDAVTGKISTVAGKASSGFSGDGGLATAATLNLGQQESQVVVHSTGALYISDTFNFRIRKVR